LGDLAALPPIIFTTSGIGSPDPLAVALADTWTANLGVTIQTELIPPADYADKIGTDHGHIFTFDWCADYPDPENMLDLLYHSAGPLNYGGYTNEEVDALLESARTEADPTARLALYQQAEEHILADTASVQVVYPQAYMLVRPYVKGFQLTAVPVVWPALVTIERE
jgi:ABC-type transport system substrate-binding protein